MQRAVFLIFAIGKFVHASREDLKKQGNIHVAVGARSLHLEAEDKATALSQLRENVKSQPQHTDQFEAHSVAHEIAQTSTGLAQIHQLSAELRRQVDALTADMGLDSSVSQQQDSTAESHREVARARLKELAHHRAQVQQSAADLDQRMQAQFASLEKDHATGERGEALISVKEVAHETDQQAAEDKMFEEMEEHTHKLMHWFSELKELRKQKSDVKQKGQAVFADAKEAGLSSWEVQKELLHPDIAASLAETSEAGEQQDKRQQLSEVMVSSAMEMAQIESAANDVMQGLDELTKWKDRHDQSPESLQHASRVKAKLDKALHFLSEHENVVNTRTQQINALMTEVGMAPM